MARNAVQFQKELSMAQFNWLYGTEEQCNAALVRSPARTALSGSLRMALQSPLRPQGKSPPPSARRNHHRASVTQDPHRNPPNDGGIIGVIRKLNEVLVNANGQRHRCSVWDWLAITPDDRYATSINAGASRCV